MGYPCSTCFEAWSKIWSWLFHSKCLLFGKFQRRFLIKSKHVCRPRSAAVARGIPRSQDTAPPLDPTVKLLSGALWWSSGGRLFLTGEVPLFAPPQRARGGPILNCDVYSSEPSYGGIPHVIAYPRYCRFTSYRDTSLTRHSPLPYDHRKSLDRSLL